MENIAAGPHARTSLGQHEVVRFTRSTQGSNRVCSRYLTPWVQNNYSALEPSVRTGHSVDPAGNAPLARSHQPATLLAT
jgi:hypothetical protein